MKLPEALMVTCPACSDDIFIPVRWSEGRPVNGTVRVEVSLCLSAVDHFCHEAVGVPDETDLTEEEADAIWEAGEPVDVVVSPEFKVTTTSNSAAPDRDAVDALVEAARAWRSALTKENWWENDEDYPPTCDALLAALAPFDDRQP